jgi:CBS-domain-containing membrane protein
MNALDRGMEERSVGEVGASRLIVSYPDELVEEAVARMARHHIGRLPVVERGAADRLVGYFGRTGIAAAWRQLLDEEHVREAGWLSARLRLLRRNMRRVLGNGGRR